MISRLCGGRAAVRRLSRAGSACGRRGRRPGRRWRRGSPGSTRGVRHFFPSPMTCFVGQSPVAVVTCTSVPSRRTPGRCGTEKPRRASSGRISWIAQVTVGRATPYGSSARIRAELSTDRPAPRSNRRDTRPETAEGVMGQAARAQDRFSPRSSRQTRVILVGWPVCQELRRYVQPSTSNSPAPPAGWKRLTAAGDRWCSRSCRAHSIAPHPVSAGPFLTDCLCR